MKRLVFLLILLFPFFIIPKPTFAAYRGLCGIFTNVDTSNGEYWTFKIGYKTDSTNDCSSGTNPYKPGDIVTVDWSAFWCANSTDTNCSNTSADYKNVSQTGGTFDIVVPTLGQNTTVDKNGNPLQFNFTNLTNSSYPSNRCGSIQVDIGPNPNETPTPPNGSLITGHVHTTGTSCTSPQTNPAISSCNGSPNPANSGQPVTWTASVVAGSGSGTYTGYTWSGDGFSAPETTGGGSTSTRTTTYDVPSQTSKTVSVTVTDSDGKTSYPYACQVTVNPCVCNSSSQNQSNICPVNSFADTCNNANACHGTKSCPTGYACTSANTCEIINTPYCSTNLTSTQGPDASGAYTINASISTNISSVQKTRWFLDGSEITPTTTYTSLTRSLYPVNSSSTNCRHNLSTSVVSGSGSYYVCSPNADNISLGCTTSTTTTTTTSGNACPSTPKSKNIGDACQDPCECSSGRCGTPNGSTTNQCLPSQSVNTCTTFKPTELDPPLNGNQISPTSNIYCPANTSPDASGTYWCYPSYGCSGGAGIPLKFKLPDDGYNCGGRTAHIYYCDAYGNNCSEALSTQGGNWQVHTDNSSTWEFIACSSDFQKSGIHSWYVYVTCNNGAVSPCNSNTAYFNTCNNSCSLNSAYWCGMTYYNQCGNACTGTLCPVYQQCSSNSCVVLPVGKPVLNSAAATCNTTTNTSQVNLSWSPSANTSSYQVYRYQPGNNPVLIGTVNAVANASSYSYVDPTMNTSPGTAPLDLTTYDYYITATNYNLSYNSSTPQEVTTRKCNLPAWIQTFGGDVHSNYSINSTGGP